MPDLKGFIMHFDWDENKNQINIEKHKLNFEDAKVLFENDLVVVPDMCNEYNEPRFIGYGLIDNRLMVVVFTERILDIIRIISFRKANRREQTTYNFKN